jgi:hypothetical protein
MIKAGEISEIIKRQLAGFEAEVDLQEVGRVIEVGDGIARVYGLEKAMAGELLQFPGDVIGMVLNLEQDQVGAVLLGEDRAIKEGTRSSAPTGSPRFRWARRWWVASSTRSACRWTARARSRPRSSGRSSGTPLAWWIGAR